jgi:3'-phosphoadenosine 5'-phosphosulfate sulfotransferase (PAPS reductase)/FAD synthetase
MSTTRRLYDRREILAAAAGVAAAAGLPFSSFATPALGAPRVQPLADWTIDDQWGVVPRWDAIPCVPRQSDDARVALAHSADVGFLV